MIASSKTLSDSAQSSSPPIATLGQAEEPQLPQVNRWHAAALKAWPYLTLASVGAMIFWHVSGMLCYDGDDYAQTQLSIGQAPTTFSDYWHLLDGRNALRWSYYLWYQLAGKNIDTPTVVFIALFVGSAFYLFRTLEKSVSTISALLGSLFYLSVVAKYRGVIVFNAQMYVTLMIFAIAIFQVMTSRLSRKTQCMIIAALLSISFHFYEILMVLVPIVPIVWLGPSVLKRRFPGWKTICYSAIPCLITGAHIALLSMEKHPIWQRNDRTSLTQLPYALFMLFRSSMNQIFGTQHWDKFLFLRVENFFKVDLRSDHSLWFPIAATVACLVSTGYVIVRNRTANQNTRNKHALLTIFFASLYVGLFGSLIAIGEFNREVPSRLLMLPCLGLAIALATGLDLIRGQHRLHQLCAIVALLWCSMDTVLLANIIQQHKSSIQTDKFITSRLAELKNFRLKQGDYVFFSLPYDQRMRTYWHDSRPAYDAIPVCLWGVYNLQFELIKYVPRMREPSSLEPHGLYNWMTASLQEASPGQLVPLYLDDKQHLRPITSLTVLDNKGKIQRRVYTALHGHVDAKDETDMKMIAGLD